MDRTLTLSLKFIKRLLLFGSVVALVSMSPMFRLVKIDVDYLAEGKFPRHNDERIEFTGTITRIAHAGGMHNGRRYRNDMYALSANASNFTFFEIDLIHTTDHKLICLHDWKDSFSREWQEKDRNDNGQITFSEFREISGKRGCWPERLKRFVAKQPDKFIVTDIKETDNLKALEQLLSSSSNKDHRKMFLKNFVPQVYTPNELKEAQQLGFKRIILTLYRSKLSDLEILKHLKYLDVWAVTMPTDRVNVNFVKALKKKGVRNIFTHPVDSCAEVERLQTLGVTGIYTSTITDVSKAANGEVLCKS